MHLGNLINVVAHYLLIKGETYLGYQDEVFMMCALLYLVTHWRKLMVNYDIDCQVVMTSPNYYVA